MLEKLVNCFLKAFGGNIIKSPEKGCLCLKNTIQLVRRKLIRYLYDGIIALEGVLEQLVNCFMGAIVGCFALIHMYITSLLRYLSSPNILVLDEITYV